MEPKKLADYIIANQVDISNLKLQKLLFYVHGCYSALFKKPLLPNGVFEAWEHGPVVKEVYHEFKSFKDKFIPKPSKVMKLDLPKEEIDAIEEALSVFGKYSAWYLRNLSHEEQPWINAYNKGKKTVIDENAITEHFKSKYINA